MSWQCDVCGENLHLIRENNKNKLLRCPLEVYKKVKSFYTPDLRNLLASILFEKNIPISNDPEGLKELAKLVPNETPLSEHIKKCDGYIYTRTLVIQAKLDTFFLHFNRILIEIYDDNNIHFVDPLQEAEKGEFNYFWLSPTHLRESYFKDGLDKAKLKSLTEMGIPSLMLFPIGRVASVKNKAWGDILLDLITHRAAIGKPTWIINTKGLDSCPEIKSSEALKQYLSSSERTHLKLDSDEEMNTFKEEEKKIDPKNGDAVPIRRYS